MVKSRETALSETGNPVPARFREPVKAQPVDATPSNPLIGQNFSQGIDLSELYSIKPKPDSIFRLYQKHEVECSS